MTWGNRGWRTPWTGAASAAFPAAAEAGTAPALTELPGREDDTEALAKLGEAFLARLGVPEGMTAAEAAEAIIAMWQDPGFSAKANVAEAPAPEPSGEQKALRLPAPLKGGLADAPEADYESMSAEQFRRLTGELRRASRDGRKIRL